MPIPTVERPFAKLYDVVQDALADWEACQLEGIQETAQGGPQYWTARAWLLERRLPHKYSRRDRVDHRHDLNVVLPAVPPADQELPEQIEGTVLEGHRALPSGEETDA